MSSIKTRKVNARQRSPLQIRIRRDLVKIQRKINKVHDPSKKARLINAYVDLLEVISVNEQAAV